MHYLEFFWNMLVGRIHGPLTLRLILQPALASFFAVKSGLKDAREGKPAYLFDIYSDPEYRRELMHHGWKDLRNVFIMAVVLDSVYQVIVFRWIFIGQSILVAVVLTVIPYLLIRGPINRIVRRGSNGPPALK